jgi:hypothetical protein
VPNLHAILAYGLTWSNSNIDSVERRADFPSWSWAGWITSALWPSTAYFHFDAENSAHLSLAKNDGTNVVLTEDLIDQISAVKSDEMSFYTHPPSLHIEAKILRIRFIDLMKHGCYTEHLAPASKASRNAWLRFRWAVIQSVEPEREEIYWLFRPTPPDDDEVVIEALSTQTFDCIILTSNYGLVVREVNGIMERLGRLDLYGRKSLSALWKNNFGVFRDGPYLGDYVPGERRQIVLG